MARITKYKCENCGAINSHIDSYNDKYCYDCIDISTGKLKEEFAKGHSNKEEFRRKF